MSEERFNLELLRLLVQAAWSDGHLAKREADMVFSLGRTWNVDEQHLGALHRALLKGDTVPSPDLEILRRRPDDVLMAVRALMATDGRFAEREQHLLEKIRTLVESSSGSTPSI